MSISYIIFFDMKDWRKLPLSNHGKEEKNERKSERENNVLLLFCIYSSILRENSNK